MHSQKNTYLLATNAVLEKPSGSLSDDGRSLVEQCLDSISNLTGFPPKLLVLLATTSFQPFEDLLAGIQNELRSRKVDVPLIGCSVAAVVTAQNTLPDGAALVCLASRFMSVNVGIARNVFDENCREGAVQSLCEQIDLNGKAEILNPNGNQCLLCFLPGYVKNENGICYKAPEIHKALRDVTRGQIPMAGGVAGDRFKRENSWQFFNGEVEDNSAVVALIESDLRFGMAMNHGLKKTGEFLHVERIEKGGHRILTFQRSITRNGKKTLEEKTAKEILDEYDDRGEAILLGAITSEGKRTVFYPQADKPGGSIHVSQPVESHQSIEVLKCEQVGLWGTAGRVVDDAIKRDHLDPFHLGIILGFVCLARHELVGAMGWEVKSPLRHLAQRFPDIPIIGGLMCGEIGQDMFGRAVMRNWMVSTFLVSDEQAARSLSRKGYSLLATASRRMSSARSISRALSVAMEIVGDIGFPGGMISLVFKHRGRYVFVGRKALGKKWQKIVQMTERKAEGKDILAIVGHTQKAEFVWDSREDPRCESRSASICEVISQVILPLRDGRKNPIGTIQIDLGDMSNRRNLPPYFDMLLQNLAGRIALALSHAIHIHELSLSNLFDRALGISLAESTVVGAAQKFVNVLAENKKLVGTDRIHIRLTAEDGLKLVAGCGPYFEAAKKERFIISFNDSSPTARTFKYKQSKWVNRVDDDEDSSKFVASLPNSRTKQVLKGERSYVNLLIRSKNSKQTLGVITLSSPKAWFFSESLLRSMKALGHRLYFALKHAEQVESEHQSSREVEFLMDTTPKLSTELDLRTSLRENAERIAKATSAEKVSFFLSNDKQDAFILQGYFGWVEDMVGRAEYRLGEGMTGIMAEMKKPKYISDLTQWKQRHAQGPAKYEKEMFGSKSEDTRYEVIGIPLQFGRLLGVLTLQNMIERVGPKSKFTTIDEEGLLTEIADDLSAFIYASIAYEKRVQSLIDEKRSVERLHYAATIVGHMTHDLRNDLESILADARTLTDNLEDHEERKRAQRVESVCEQLASRMDKYLIAIERKEPPTWTVVELAAILSNAIKRCDEKVKSGHISVKLCPGANVSIKGSEIELEDALFCVMDNGLNAMQKKTAIRRWAFS